jgi:hypothetical protein
MANDTPDPDGGGAHNNYLLSFDGSVITLPIAPESLEISYTARTQVTPTFTRAYVEHFGPGLGSISISGTMGWGANKNQNRKTVKVGLVQMKDMVDKFNAYLVKAAASSSPDSIHMTFTDGGTGRTYRVVPEHNGLREQAHKSSPMLRRYSMSLIMVQDITGGNIQGTSIRLAKLDNLFGESSDTFAQSLFDDAEASVEEQIALTTTRTYYRLAAGDTLVSVAALFGLDAQTLAARNNILVPSAVQTGLVLDVTYQRETYETVRRLEAA